MKIKDYKCKCEHDDFFFVDKGNQKGIYCSYCGKWYKWADKDEQNLSMKQEPTAYILDKIRAEIEDIPNNPATKPVGTFDYVTGATNERRIILEIINKYRGDTDGNS